MGSINDKLRELVGSTCYQFRLVEGGTLILHLRFTDRRLPCGVEMRLWIDCAWRIRDEDTVLTGSLNEPDRVLEYLSQLSDQTLASISCDEGTKDLHIRFGSGLTIESFSHSTQDEIWEVRRSDGYRLGIGGGLIPYERHGG